METRQQGTSLLTALCLLIGIVVVVQLWLVSAALDALLGGETAILVPAAIASAALAVLNAGLLSYGLAFDRRLGRRLRRVAR